MADPGEASASSPPSSSIPADQKPVVVRVKRKLSQARVDALWLEINERPLKRRLLDMGTLSISDTAEDEKVQQESRTKKLLLQHVETISQSEAIKDVLHSFLPDPNGAKDFKRKIEGRRSMLNQDKKQDQLRSVARREHEDSVRNARFEQIWKRRKGNKEADDFILSELCHLYDVVRVDGGDEKSRKVQEKSKEDVLENNAILCNYLPLLREFIPVAAEEIESELNATLSKEENYVYDLYTVEDSPNSKKEVDLNDYPLVQVNDDVDDYFDGLMDSEYDSDDSNAEDNPRNDYPDEDSNEDGSGSNGEDPLNEFGSSDSGDDEEIADDDGDREEEWKWGYR